MSTVLVGDLSSEVLFLAWTMDSIMPFCVGMTSASGIVTVCGYQEGKVPGPYCFYYVGGRPLFHHHI